MGWVTESDSRLRPSSCVQRLELDEVVGLLDFSGADDCDWGEKEGGGEDEKGDMESTGVGPSTVRRARVKQWVRKKLEESQ